MILRLLILIVAIFFQASSQARSFERPEHVVVVIEENKSLGDIIGNKDAPYLNQLAGQGALMTESYAVAHPSLPNYLALFSGSTHEVKDDDCNYKLTGPNLAQSLQKAGLTFKIFSESMPGGGFTGCRHDAYRKKHNPDAYFSILPGDYNQTFGDFPKDFSHLPTISFVIPNLNNDMHDGTIAGGDQWLQKNLGDYIEWAQTHHSLLIVTWDEDDDSNQNHIPTIIIGENVKPGKYSQHIDHYNVLKTLATFYAVKSPNKAGKAQPITGIWR